MYACLHTLTLFRSILGTAHLLELLVGVLQAYVVQVSVLSGLEWSQSSLGQETSADTKPCHIPRAISNSDSDMRKLYTQNLCQQNPATPLLLRVERHSRPRRPTC